MTEGGTKAVSAFRRMGPLGHTVIFVVGFYLLLKAFLPILGGWLAADGWFAVREGLRSTGQETSLYMTLGVLAWYCYLTYDETRWEEFRAPIYRFLGRASGLRTGVLVAFPVLAGVATFYGAATGGAEPSMSALRHPTPPEKFSKMENPYRHPTAEMLTAFDRDIRSGKIDAETSTEEAVREYAAALEEGNTGAAEREEAYHRRITEEGRELFMINCRPCHGTRAMGDGPMSLGQRREPADFTGVETIATLVEGAVFWRVKKGGIGLPHVGAPWESAMPRWETDLTDEEIWKIITAEYDIAGNLPREPEGREEGAG